MTTATTPQRPIGSGFGARSTAAEVLDGIDLSGTLAIVTGGYSGIGLETTRALAGAGARVVVPARRPEAARESLAGLDQVETERLDLGDLDSVREFGERFLATGRTVDHLICNAGIMAAPLRLLGPGWESHFALNHLGHFALVARLWSALSTEARIVAVSSGAHHQSGIRWEDLHFSQGYDRWAAYAQSKTANVLFAIHLDRLARERGVRAFSLHPGAILTPLQRHMTVEEMVEAGWIHQDGTLADPSFKTPEQGAATQVWAATSPRLAGKGGVYCLDCDIAELAEVSEHAIDAGQAARLWSVSAELTGLDPFAV
jgi:NAD(P)-dependent dehydrogenase (short-subunit alcohol dehydrogenase family)